MQKKAGPSGYSASSSKSRVGDRYFKVDPGYDKKVYVNDWVNYIKIAAAFAVYYTFCCIIWITVLLLGIYKPDISTYVCIGFFVFGVVVSTYIPNSLGDPCSNCFRVVLPEIQEES